ncbi:hypothetical protein K504DRAFT_462509 [Pleomassaria siparia CBS 279.74]|uniref:Uncharacterized protein n=1 Tax=Pleomassaria siparia CBS 279.74 TaxID=1314801 RepID=A0A6G1KMI8_9PLEO|nr:hypothetical protein K504DRAFT_462509 [Pleomassaria siparia CBS 279.74]
MKSSLFYLALAGLAQFSIASPIDKTSAVGTPVARNALPVRIAREIIEAKTSSDAEIHARGIAEDIILAAAKKKIETDITTTKDKVLGDLGLEGKSFDDIATLFDAIRAPGDDTNIEAAKDKLLKTLGIEGRSFDDIASVIDAAKEIIAKLLAGSASLPSLPSLPSSLPSSLVSLPASLPTSLPDIPDLPSLSDLKLPL